MNISNSNSDTNDYDKYMPLDERDTLLVQIENAKERARAKLLEKYFVINEKASQNVFLGGVARKYSDFYNDILKQREDQINALNVLYEHIEDMKNTGNEMSVSQKKDLEREQKTISKEIGELEKLKMELLKEK